MNALLICPSESPAVQFLSETAPLSNVPLLGQGLLEYWLSYLAGSGTRQVIVLAHDRPEQVQALAGDGARWGLAVKVIAESRELTPAQALLKYAEELDPAPAQGGIVVLNHFPGMPERPLFTSYADWFAALHAWMARAITPDRVGMREVRPGVWVGSHSRLSPTARLQAPCWVGKHVSIGDGAVIGPHAIVEDGAFVEPDVEIVRSCVGPETFVGRFARIANSLACGSTLINWETGSAAQVPDAFLLCSLRQPRHRRLHGWLARCSELYTRNKAEVHMLWKHLLMHKES